MSSEGTPICTSSSKDVLNKVWLTSILSPSHSLPRLFLKEPLGRDECLASEGSVVLATVPPCCCFYNSHLGEELHVLQHTRSPLLPGVLWLVVVGQEECVSLFWTFFLLPC